MQSEVNKEENLNRIITVPNADYLDVLKIDYEGRRYYEENRNHDRQPQWNFE